MPVKDRLEKMDASLPIRVRDDAAEIMDAVSTFSFFPFMMVTRVGLLSLWDRCLVGDRDRDDGGMAVPKGRLVGDIDSPLRTVDGCGCFLWRRKIPVPADPALDMLRSADRSCNFALRLHDKDRPRIPASASIMASHVGSSSSCCCSCD